MSTNNITLYKAVQDYGLSAVIDCLGLPQVGEALGAEKVAPKGAGTCLHCDCNNRGVFGYRLAKCNAVNDASHYRYFCTDHAIPIMVTPDQALAESLNAGLVGDPRKDGFEYIIVLITPKATNQARMELLQKPGKNCTAFRWYEAQGCFVSSLCAPGRGFMSRFETYDRLQVEGHLEITEVNIFAVHPNGTNYHAIADCRGQLVKSVVGQHLAILKGTRPDRDAKYVPLGTPLI